ncbi:hypothetical protein EAE99_006088 [Botrytis elliptica]|nr:hypothetical protein EAE99_006088 [Botrytis elliptica]
MNPTAPTHSIPSSVPKQAIHHKQYACTTSILEPSHPQSSISGQDTTPPPASENRIPLCIHTYILE